MSKNRHFTGQPIFAQLIKLLNGVNFSPIIEKHQANRYTKKFTAFQHVVTMLYASLGKLNSLREVVTGLLANQHAFAHIGLSSPVRRSTLAEANANRPSAFFADVFHHLAGQMKTRLPDSCIPSSILKRLVIIDSTVISLFKDILSVAGRPRLDGKRKGGIKAHVAIDGQHLSPVFVRHSAATEHDSSFLTDVERRLTPGSWVVMDRGYTDYQVYKRWTLEGIWYVSRAKCNADFRHVQTLPLTQEHTQAGIISDAIVAFKLKSGAEFAQRHIVYGASGTKEALEFLTNNMDTDALTICQIYKRRWEIEVLFKKLKSNFPLTYFLGDSVNAVEIQLWCCFIALLLLEWVQKQVKKEWALSHLATMIRLHVFTYIDLIAFLNDPEGQLQSQTFKITQMELFQT